MQSEALAAPQLQPDHIETLLLISNGLCLQTTIKLSRPQMRKRISVAGALEESGMSRHLQSGPIAHTAFWRYHTM
jgi:hypothetical protein